nr:immunoglobulin heavy chain junction region [Macaca mulatta]MOX58988.1 immunoglobulin heavy chain junction region [Macaca mulatta]MOX61601.1 immunoglobulin heavy chain junction region [Macaca mulatta]MOX61812.1 immunoglobulin heavy chain junction region [Macaca mulatta]MOX62541.1 immunoglobulin heavy chain junction region [Macaca mulatta]
CAKRGGHGTTTTLYFFDYW